MKKLIVKILTLVLSLAMCGSVLVGCDKTPTPTPPVPDPEPPLAVTITLNKTAATLEVDEVLQLITEVLNAGTDYTVGFTSSVPAIASVSAQGKVTALTAGITIITATVGEVSATCTVTVEAKKASVDFTSNNVEYNKIAIPLNSSYLLPTKVMGEVLWSADRAGITVSNGTILATAAGDYKVTATANGIAKVLDITAYDVAAAGKYLKQYSAAADLKTVTDKNYWGENATVYSVKPMSENYRFGMDVDAKQVLYRYEFVMPSDYAKSRNPSHGLGGNILGIYNLNEDGKGGNLAEFIKDKSVGGEKDGYEGDLLRVYDKDGKMIETPVLATFKGGEKYTFEFNCKDVAVGRYLSVAMTNLEPIYISNVAALYSINHNPTIIFDKPAVATAPDTSLTVAYSTENIADTAEIKFTCDKAGFTVVNNGDSTFTVSIAAGTTEKRATVTAAYGENCSETILVNNKEIEIELSDESAEIFVGKTKALTANLENAGDGAAIAWDSSDKEVATVLNGVVTAIKVGNTNITAACKGVTKTCIVTVTQESSIKFESNGIAYNGIDIPVGAAYKLPIVSEGVVVWSVQDAKDGLTVNDGVITATAAGLFTVNAAADKGNASLTVKVYAEANSADYLKFTKNGGTDHNDKISKYTESVMNVWNTNAYIYKISQGGISVSDFAEENVGLGMIGSENMVMYSFDIALDSPLKDAMYVYGDTNFIANINWNHLSCIKTSADASGGGYENDLIAIYDELGAYIEKPTEKTFVANKGFTIQLNTVGLSEKADKLIKMNICFKGTMFITNVVALYNMPATPAT